MSRGGKRRPGGVPGVGSRGERGQRPGGAGRMLVFGVVVAILVLIVVGLFNNSQPKDALAGSVPVRSADRIDVVYFHRTERCDSCIWAGQMSRKTVESYFAAELASGRVTFREVDVQKPENSALAAKYGASGSSLFLDYVSQGKDNIVEAQQTYPYVGNEARFTGALRTMIAAGLGKS